jgi:hypothetical protein
MVTITDAIKHAIGSAAKEIQHLKTSALKVQRVKSHVYASPDGKTTRKQRPTKEEYSAGWRMIEVDFDRVIEHISPRHPDWRRYQAARRRASLLLTARIILKLGGESVPDLSVVRRGLKDGRLTSHASPRRARSLTFAAWRYLRKLANRLERAPDKFSVVEAWVVTRRQTEAEPRKEEQINV